MADEPPARGYGNRSDTVHFDLYRDYLIVVRGSAGPLKGLNFLLDTGASPVIDRPVAGKLQLTEQPGSMAVLGGSVQAGQATVPSLEVGPVRRENLNVVVEDLSFFQKVFPVRIDAVVGLDVLGPSSFEIDYAAHSIRFGAMPALKNSCHCDSRGDCRWSMRRSLPVGPSAARHRRFGAHPLRTVYPQAGLTDESQ